MENNLTIENKISLLQLAADLNQTEPGLTSPVARPKVEEIIEAAEKLKQFVIS